MTTQVVGSGAVLGSWRPKLDQVTNALNAAGTNLRVTHVLRQPESDLRATYYARSMDDPSKAFVVHLLPAEDVIDAGVPTESTFLLSQRFVSAMLAGSPVEMVFVIREKTTLLENQRPTTQTRTVSSLRTRVKVLQDVLRGLADLHAVGRIAGDLRLGNVALTSTGAALVDYQIRPTKLRDGGVETSRPREVPTASDDIVAFTYLAKRLLGGYTWDARTLIPDNVGLRTSGFEWVLDYCTSVAEEDIPTPNQLIETIFSVPRPFSNVPVPISRLVEQAVVAAKEAFIAECDEGKRGQLARRAATGAHWMLRTRFADYPETQIAFLSLSRVHSLFEWCILDESGHICNNHAHNDIDINSFISDRAVERGSLESGIDDTWRDRIHQLHFGIPIGLDHDDRMAAAKASGDVLEGAEDYDEHIRGMCEVRRTLLDAHTFLHTDDVAELLSPKGGEMPRAELLVLRRWGAILAVPDHGRWLYPAFQFDPACGRPSALIGEVATTLGTDDPWQLLSWWTVGRPFLSGESLAAVVHKTTAEDAVRRALLNQRPMTAPF